MDTRHIETMDGYGYDDAGDNSRDSVSQWRGAIGRDTTAGKKHQARDSLDSIFANVNRDLLVSKSFYLLYFGACGSLFPLIAIYFKQLAMTPTQTGILLGVRPIVEMLAAPLWGAIVARFHRAKSVLLLALFCWVAFTLALAFIQPSARACLTRNSTHLVLAEPWKQHMGIGGYGNGVPAPPGREDEIALEGDDLIPVTAGDTVEEGSGEIPVKAPPPLYYTTLNEALPPEHQTITAYGKSPLPLPHKHLAHAPRTDDLAGIDDLVSAPFSSAVYEASDVRAVFFMLLILTILGVSLGAPAVMLADTATLAYLGKGDADNYGRQRMWGSIGWGLSLFLVGIALDRASLFRQHPCGQRQSVERNYTICFAVFSVLMSCAFLAATQFRFRSDIGGDHIALDDMKDEGLSQNGKKKTNDLHISLEGANGQTTAIQDAAPVQRPSTFVPRGAPGPFGSKAEWRNVLYMFAAPRFALTLYITWFMGFAVGLVFTFLFWHLQDIGGTPTLFGVASVINHVSEIVAYFLTGQLIQAVGHIRVLYLGLLGNIARFLYISYLRDPWWVLPFELITGLTHAAVWAACCSYVTQASLAPYRQTTQIVMQGVHHGLGRGCGSIVGGILVYYFGTEYVFRGYGIACIAVLIATAAIHWFYISRVGANAGNDSHQLLEETSHLAPCGVPMSVSRNLSSSKLENMGDNEDPERAYGSAAPNGFLDPQTTKSPFIGSYQAEPSYQYSQTNQAEPSYQYSQTNQAPLPAPIKPPPSKRSSGPRTKQIYQGQSGDSDFSPMERTTMPTTEPYMLQPESRDDQRVDDTW